VQVKASKRGFLKGVAEWLAFLMLFLVIQRNNQGHGFLKKIF
jgi:hypothetical protein